MKHEAITGSILDTKRVRNGTSNVRLMVIFGGPHSPKALNGSTLTIKITAEITWSKEIFCNKLPLFLCKIAICPFVVCQMQFCQKIAHQIKT